MIRILLVDDAKDFVEYTSKRLRLRGMNVATATSGEEALAAISERPIDVVVLDVLMPGLDGLETLKAIKKIQPEIQVIMLTGHGAVENAEVGLDQGAVEYLLKPCEFDLLLRTIESAYEDRNNPEG